MSAECTERREKTPKLKPHEMADPGAKENAVANDRAKPKPASSSSSSHKDALRESVRHLQAGEWRAAAAAAGRVRVLVF